MKTALNLIKWILILLVVLALLAFALVNASTRVDVRFLPFSSGTTGGWSLGAIIAGVALLSFIAMFVAGLFDQVEDRLEKRALRKKVKILEKEVHSLRKAPIEETAREDKKLAEENGNA